MITDQVRAAATVGAAITLTVNVDASSLSPAEAAVTTVVSQQPPVGGSIPPLPPTTLQPIPGNTITPPSLGGLFPTVTPTSSPSAKEKQKAAGKVTRATQASSALPLDPRLIGGQLAGLAVLAAAITMVVARLSLRTPQPAGPAGPEIPPADPDSAGKSEDDQPEG